jgi:hypothetical protein
MFHLSIASAELQKQFNEKDSHTESLQQGTV